MDSFTTKLTVKGSPQEVFEAINDVRAWWTGNIEGRADAVGAEFTYSYKKLHRTTQKVTELVPSKKVVWHVTDSHIEFVENKGEWEGTDIVFDIQKKGDETEVRFTHVGLVPKCECYDACREGWSFYVNDSLRKLIEKRAGDR